MLQVTKAAAADNVKAHQAKYKRQVKLKFRKDGAWTYRGEGNVQHPVTYSRPVHSWVSSRDEWIEESSYEVDLPSDLVQDLGVISTMFPGACDYFYSEEGKGTIFEQDGERTLLISEQDFRTQQGPGRVRTHNPKVNGRRQVFLDAEPFEPYYTRLGLGQVKEKVRRLPPLLILHISFRVSCV